MLTHLYRSIFYINRFYNITTLNSNFDQINIFTYIVEIDLRETGWDGMDWIDLAQDRDQWRALVNTVITSGFNKMLEVVE
jgi:hypothetical protein